MKRFLWILCLFFFILMFAACSAPPSDPGGETPSAGTTTPEPTAAPPASVPAVTGFRYYTADAARFQYPVRWAEINQSNISGEEAQRLLGETLGLDAAGVEEDLRGHLAFFYDESRSAAGLPAYLSFAASDSGGHTAESFSDASVAEYYSENLGAAYQDVYAEFSWITPPETAEFGTVPGISLSFGYEYGQERLEVRQFMTVLGGSLYTFNFTVPESAVDDELQNMLMQVFSTLEFS